MNGESAAELILLLMVAGFVVLRLRSVLGRRVGFERAPGSVAAAPPAGRGPTVDGVVEVARPQRELPAPDSLAGQGLTAIRRADSGFDAQRFLSNAEAAFRMIVAAFARGDRAALRPLLGPDTFAAFDRAIGAREEADETQRSEIKAVQSIGILSATMAGPVARIALRIVSDQVNATFDKAGAPLHGTDAVTELTDIWAFERDTSSRDPAWHLADARTG